MLILTIFFGLFHYAISNLVANGDFEPSIPPALASWSSNGGKITLNRRISHGGISSLLVYDRSFEDEGCCQYVPLQEGHYYKFSAYVKQLNDIKGTLLQSYNANVKYSNMPESMVIANQPFISSKSNWILLEGVFTAPPTGFEKSELCIQGPDAGIEFLVDDVSIEEFAANSNWKAEANTRIEEIRKSKIRFNFKLDKDINKADITVRVDHKRHLFGIGGFIDINWITDPRYPAYQSMIYDLFNWATVTSLSWPSSKASHVDTSYTTAKSAAQELKKHGVKVRGNAMFGRRPYWLGQLDSDALKEKIRERITDMTNGMNGLIDQWDVLDDALDDSFYQEKTGDPNYLQRIFDMLQQADPSTLRYINDDNAIADGSQTSAYSELAQELKSSGLNGIGAKGYFPVLPPDPTLVKLRLDRLSAADVPIWITEMGVSHVDENIRADLLEDALRLYFSHKSVDGVTIKDVWESLDNQKFTTIANGFDFKLNAAGRRLKKLLKTEWSTRVSQSLARNTAFTIDAFQGDYDITILKRGIPIDKAELKLGKSDIIFEMNVGDGFKGAGIKATDTSSVPSTSPLPQVQTSSSSAPQATATSKASPQVNALQCVTRMSNHPAVTENGTTDVSCQGHEWLTGCSSMIKNTVDGDLAHTAQFIVLKDGALACRATAFSQLDLGVYAEARCCSTKDLKCEYNVSRSVSTNSGVETFCPANYIATGCASVRSGSVMHGMFPSDDLKGCLAEDGGTNSGVMAGAACCSSASLTCTTVTSPPSGLGKGNHTYVTCGPYKDYVMTSCNGRSHGGVISGMLIADTTEGSECVAFNGANQHAPMKGVEAVAVCCHANQLAPLVG